MGYSCVIRTKDSERTIKETLSLVLSQTLPPDDVIIVDNQSSDSTLAIVQSLVPYAKIVHYPLDTAFNYSKSLNLGLEQVTTEYALILSSHVSISEAGSLAKAIAFLSDNRDCAAVRLGLKGNNEHLKPGFVVLQSGGCSNRSQVIRLSVWEETVFQEWIPTCEDKLWEKEATASGWKFAVLPEVASYHNPYMNTAKESQEFYTMARYIESRRCSLSHAVQLLGAAGRELIRGNREKTKHYLELFRSKVQGSLGLARHFHSDSYRRKPS